MLDVKDLWPQIIVDSFPTYIKPIARILLSPLYYQASYCVNNATSLCSMTPAYISALNLLYHRNPSLSDHVAPLTSPKPVVSSSPEISQQFSHLLTGSNDLYIFSFVGSFMSVFDFRWVKNLAQLLDSSSIPHIFVLAGDGPYRDDVKALMANLSNVYFPGWLNHYEVDFLYRKTFCSLIPYKNIENYTLNMPNKVVDSLSYGIPILTTLPGELHDLIDKHDIGFNGSSDDPAGFFDYICFLINHPDALHSSSLRSKQIYAECYEPSSVYERLAHKLISL